MDRVVTQRPVDHAAGVPNLVALLEQAEIKDVLDIRVGRGGVLIGELVLHAHQHEDLIALTAAVQEALATPEPERHVLGVARAAHATDDALSADGGHQDRVLDGAEGADEGRGLQVLVELDDAQDVLRGLVHSGQAHVAAELLVGLLRQVLRVHDRALSADPPVPVGVHEPQLARLARHQALHVLRHGLRVELEVLGEHAPPVAVAAPGLELAGGGGRQALPELMALEGCGGRPQGAPSEAARHSAKHRCANALLEGPGGGA
mmetsp:Transcript_38488/g.114301  ORF Transcript_38488/g.114301 Transcript_38488/m.114301 type:complete len:262 (+) Transcript_38488:316-1101(+)